MLTNYILLKNKLINTIVIFLHFHRNTESRMDYQITNQCILEAGNKTLPLLMSEWPINNYSSPPAWNCTSEPAQVLDHRYLPHLFINRSIIKEFHRMWVSFIEHKTLSFQKYFIQLTPHRHNFEKE